MPVLPGEITHFAAYTMSHYRSCDATGIADQYIVPSDSWSLALIPRIFAHDVNFGKYAKSAGARAEIRTIVYINGILIY